MPYQYSRGTLSFERRSNEVTIERPEDVKERVRNLLPEGMDYRIRLAIAATIQEALESRAKDFLRFLNRCEEGYGVSSDNRGALRDLFNELLDLGEHNIALATH